MQSRVLPVNPFVTGQYHAKEGYLARLTATNLMTVFYVVKQCSNASRSLRNHGTSTRPSVILLAPILVGDGKHRFLDHLPSVGVYATLFLLNSCAAHPFAGLVEWRAVVTQQS